jgi:RHS repeat-associated protein
MHTYVPLLANHLDVLLRTLRACAKSLSKRGRLFAAVCMCLCAALNAAGQLQQNAQFTQGTPGTNIMTCQIPLGSFPGRGVDLPLNLNYTSKVWRIGFIRSRYWTPNGKNAVAEAIYSEFATAGWTTSLDVPVVEWPKVQDVYWYTGKPYANGSVYPYTFRVARVYIHMPDGSTHELRKADGVQQDTGSVDMNGTFYAVDNSRMRYDSSGATNGVLYLPDGSRYNISSTTVQYIDRNGNTLTYNVSSRQWTDTMGRTIGMPWPANPQAGVNYEYSVPGFNGNPVTYTLKFAQLSSALSPNSAALIPVGDWYLPNPSLPPGDYNSANNPQQQSTSTMFHSAYTDPEELDFRTYTQVVGRGQPGNTNFNTVVLTEVVLPNNLSYKFSYNNYGEIDKIIYPSGAYQRYEYGWVASLGYQVAPYGASRGLKNRWFSANGTGTDEVQWTYSFEAPFVLVLTAPGPTGVANGIQTKTYLYNEPNPQNNFGYDDALNGMAYEQRIYAPASEGGALLRRTLTKWDKSSGTYNRPSPGTGTYTATRNARPIKTVSIWLDTGGNALTTTNIFDYDTTYWWNVGLDRTSSSEYAFTLIDQNTAQNGTIDSIPLGNLVRTTTTTYTTANANYRNRNILGLPTYSSISDANGVVAQTYIDYDESAYPLISVDPVTGWNDPQTTYRGNPTTVRRWLNYPSVTWIHTHTQYDHYGNVRKMWDGMGRVDPSTELSYSSTYYYAYPTTTTTIVPDPSGTYGQPSSLVKTTVFDTNTGLIISSTDQNGQTTSFEYNDSLYRQTKVMRPDNGWTTIFYNDDPANTYIRTQTLQRTSPSQQVIESYQYFDKAGRSVRSFANEGPTYLTTDTQYDLLGRVWRVSNPYRTSAPSLNSGVNPSNQWTTNTYDSQNRVTAVTTADGAHVNSSYGYTLVPGYLGTTVTASDQMGRARKSLTDAAGRIVQVVEDPGSLAYPTNYTYDAMNNLRKVEQGNQLRYFGYDSLSRVIFVRQVEQTANVSLPAWTDPVTGYAAGWTAAFTYDNNGNTLTRTDARNITATFTYDQLNRVTTLRYTNDPQSTPGVNTYYDGYHGNNYTAIDNVKGQAWQTETVGQVRFTIDNFDAMGRPTIQRQQFWWNNAWGNSYQVSVGYDFSGAITNQTYPSGRTTTYTHDRLGRLQTFSGTLGDGVSRTYANNFQYNDYGLLQQEQFGTQTALYHKQRFNSRGQLWDMRLSTVSFESDPANGDRGSIVNYFSSGYTQGGSGTDNNGNLLRQEIYVPGGPYFQQTYSFDNVNRLTAVSEKLNGTGTDSFKQIYIYDRWGNRSVNTTLSSANVPRPAYTVDTNTNRLIAPTGSNFGYDNAGNQTNDTYTGGGQRTFDAENHMLGAQENTGWQYYKYSASGLRVRRTINGVEVWQVYDFGGSLLAEYSANGAAASPEAEYGYRNGQLLITATPNVGGGGGSNSLSLNGSTAYAQVPNSTSLNISGAITVEAWIKVNAITGVYQDLITRESYSQPGTGGGWELSVTNLGKLRLDLFQTPTSYTTLLGNTTITTGVWHHVAGVFDGSQMRVYLDGVLDGTLSTTNGPAAGSSSLKIGRNSLSGSFFAGLVDEARVSNAALYTSNFTPQSNLTASSSTKGLWKFDGQTVNDSSGHANHAMLNGGATYSSDVPSGGSGPESVVWTRDANVTVTGSSLSKSVATNAWDAGANSSKAIVSGDGYVEMTVTETNKDRFFGLSDSETTVTYEDVDFAVRPYSNGVVYCYEPGTNGAFCGYYSPGDKLRIAIEGGAVKYYLISGSTSSLVYTATHAPAYPMAADAAIYSSGGTVTNAVISGNLSAGSGGGGSANVQWLVMDQLGTPRMIVDQTGALSSVKRHDYLPFGEEIGGPQVGLIGGRTGTPGYVADTLRQKFTGYQFDAETGLNYAQARYQSGVQGRFTSVDPLGASADIGDPQSFNRYSYVQNMPLTSVDPTGMALSDIGIYQTNNPEVADILYRGVCHNRNSTA